MDNSNETSCNEFSSTSVTYALLGVSSAEVVVCIAALIIALVGRFFKDTVQRLIVYKLIVMLVFSLFQFLFLIFPNYNSTKLPKTLALIVPSFIAILFFVNLVLTLWLTIVLYLCIVHLKKLENLKKLEPFAIITSVIPFFIALHLLFSSYKECQQTWEIIFTNNGGNKIEYIYITGHCTAGLLYFIISLLVVIIFIKIITRSRTPFKEERHNAMSLLTTNKWKKLLKQLLPFVAYVIVSIVLAIIYLLISVIRYEKLNIKSNGVLTIASFSIASSLIFMTSLLVLLYPFIVKCKKKMKKSKKKSLLDFAEAVVHDRSGIFTSDTLASTNFRTDYYYNAKTETIASQI